MHGVSRVVVPALCVVILLGTAVGIALLPLKAEAASCHASAVEVVRGKELAAEHEEQCHEKARTAITVAAATGGVGLVAAIATATILKGWGPRRQDSLREGPAPAGS